MKKIFLILAMALVSLFGVHAQDAATGDVTLEMADGTTVRGYGRTEMVNQVRFFEISDEPRGERTRYDSDQIDRIVFDNGATYVKYAMISAPKKDKSKEEWMRIEYEGRGITLYSAYLEGWEQVNTMRRKVSQTNYYLSLGDDPAVWASTEWHSGGVVNASGANRALLNYYFGKRHPEYADFAKRVKAREFDTKGSPVEVVRAWDEAYGGE